MLGLSKPAPAAMTVQTGKRFTKVDDAALNLLMKSDGGAEAPATLDYRRSKLIEIKGSNINKLLESTLSFAKGRMESFPENADA